VTSSLLDGLGPEGVVSNNGAPGYHAGPAFQTILGIAGYSYPSDCYRLINATLVPCTGLASRPFAKKGTTGRSGPVTPGRTRWLRRSSLQTTIPVFGGQLRTDAPGWVSRSKLQPTVSRLSSRPVDTTPTFSSLMFTMPDTSCDTRSTDTSPIAAVSLKQRAASRSAETRSIVIDQNPCLKPDETPILLGWPVAARRELRKQIRRTRSEASRYATCSLERQRLVEEGSILWRVFECNNCLRSPSQTRFSRLVHRTRR